MRELTHVAFDNIAAWTKNNCAGISAAANDLSAALSIWHTGAPTASATAAGTAVSKASVTVDTNDDLIFFINGAADTRFGVGGKLDTTNASYDTVGEVVDAVNNVSGWAARAEGALRSDKIYDSAAMVIQSDTMVDCYQKPWQMMWDTSAAEMHNFVISNRRTVIMTADDHDKGKVYMIEDEGGATNALDYLKVNFNVAGTNPVLTLYLYSIDGRSNTETLLATHILPDNSAETYDFSKCAGLTALPDQRLVGRIVCTADADTDIGTLTEFRCFGRSIGGRWRA